MKYNCDIISDLLPLYIDNACTSSSAQAVEEHLAECSVCTKLYEDMKNSENVLDSEIKKERDEVLTKQSKYFKRRSVLAGSIIGGIFSIPILVCLIVNLASGAGLSWFFIVLTAMFIPASLTVVPLMIPQNKALCTLGAFTASLLTLLGVCCIYSGGSWFAVAASSVVFGLTIVFAPFIVQAKPIAKLLKNNKGLAVVCAYTLMYVIMMICIGISSGSDSFFDYAAAYSIPVLAYMWTMFAVLRFVKLNRQLKAAICVFVSSLFFFFGDTMVNLFLGNGFILPGSPFEDVMSAADVLANRFNWVVLIFGTILSAVLAAVGIYENKKNKK